MEKCSHLLGLGNEFQNDKKRWVLLASKSPRRIELLQLIGIKNIYICDSSYEENLDKSKFSSAEDYVKENALNKGLKVVEHIWFRNGNDNNLMQGAKNICSSEDKDEEINKSRDNKSEIKNYQVKNLHSNYDPLPHIIISCDTIVFLKEEIIEKPLNKKHAYEILKKLSSNIHTVYTAVCIFLYKSKTPITFIEKTDVYFDELQEKDILEYINLDEPYDKSGAYSIQGASCQFIKKIDGCYYNVMGLPIHKLSKTLTDLYLKKKIS